MSKFTVCSGSSSFTSYTVSFEASERWSEGRAGGGLEEAAEVWSTVAPVWAMRGSVVWKKIWGGIASNSPLYD